MFLLDTNAWVALLRGKSPEILAQLQRRPAAEVALCPVVLAELWYGVHRSDPASRPTNESLVKQLQATYVSVPFDDAAAIDAGLLRAELAATGNIIGPYDLLIAAIARTQQHTLVTHNTAEFARVRGLRIEDWQLP
jgi:tRNA(fMet)-specific endonuclease VapC